MCLRIILLIIYDIWYMIYMIYDIWFICSFIIVDVFIDLKIFQDL